MLKSLRRPTLAALVLSSFATPALAHMYVQFPAYYRGGVPNPKKDQIEAIYQDGAYGPVYFDMAHTCGHFDHFVDISTTQVAVVLPSGKAARFVNTTLDGPYGFPLIDPPYQEIGDASEYGITFAKPVQYPSLDRAYPFYAVPKPAWEDPPRAAVWVGQGVPDNNTAQIPMWVNFPEIPKKSCVTDVVYFFAAAQFCPKSAEPGYLPAQAWLLGTTETWTQHYLGGEDDQWSPYTRMIRDTKAKPLPKRCSGKGETVYVYPSKTDIDRYLRPVKIDANGIAKQIPLKQWIQQNQ